MVGVAVRAGRSGGGIFGLPGFLSAGRDGRRRREADGGFRRAAGSERDFLGGAVDGGRGWNFSDFGDRFQSDSPTGCERRGKAGRGTERHDSLCAGHRAGRLVVACAARLSAKENRIWIAGFLRFWASAWYSRW